MNSLIGSVHSAFSAVASFLFARSTHIILKHSYRETANLKSPITIRFVRVHSPLCRVHNTFQRKHDLTKCSRQTHISIKTPHAGGTPTGLPTVCTWREVVGRTAGSPVALRVSPIPWAFSLLGNISGLGLQPPTLLSLVKQLRAGSSTHSVQLFHH